MDRPVSGDEIGEEGRWKISLYSPDDLSEEGSGRALFGVYRG